MTFGLDYHNKILKRSILASYGNNNERVIKVSWFRPSHDLQIQSRRTSPQSNPI